MITLQWNFRDNALHSIPRIRPRAIGATESSGASWEGTKPPGFKEQCLLKENLFSGPQHVLLITNDKCNIRQIILGKLNRKEYLYLP